MLWSDVFGHRCTECERIETTRKGLFNHMRIHRADGGEGGETEDEPASDAAGSDGGAAGADPESDSGPSERGRAGA